MNNEKLKVHFTDKYLISPTNPISINVIGAGGTGSQMLSALARMNHSLIALGHAGLQVSVFDDDTVSKANLGRQLFSQAELGLNKGVAIVNRLNRFYGTNWKAIPKRYDKKITERLPRETRANITISCVDSVQARFEIAEILAQSTMGISEQNKPLYWLDTGNGKFTGQVVLATIGDIAQPRSKRFGTVSKLPFVTEEFKHLFNQAEQDDDTPSCSLAEALEKQDLFINSTLASVSASLLWQLFREGMIYDRGFFLNLKGFRMQPLKVA